MANWLGTYAKRISVTVDLTKVDETLTHFPVPIIISALAGQSNQDLTAIFTDVGASYLKIAVTSYDGAVQLYCDVEKWDAVGNKALIHVGLSTFSIFKGISTTFYIYFDPLQADNTTYVGLTGSVPAQSVWDSNFKAVYHMNQDPSGGVGAIFDATVNANVGTTTGTMLTADLVDSVVGKGIDYDGADDGVTVAQSASLNDIAALSVELVGNVDLQTGAGAASQLVGKTNWSLVTDPGNAQNLFNLTFSGANASYSFTELTIDTYKHVGISFNNYVVATEGLWFSDPCAGKVGLEEYECQMQFAWYYAGNDPCYGLGGPDLYDCEEQWAWWYNGVAPWAGLSGLAEQEMRELFFWVHDRVRTPPLVYYDGVSQTVTVEVEPVGTYTSDAAAVMVIANTIAGTSGLDGEIEELRISAVERSAAWYKVTSYAFQDNLLTFGTVTVYSATSVEPTPTDCEIITDPYGACISCPTFNPLDPFVVTGYAVSPFADCGDVCASFDPAMPYGISSAACDNIYTAKSIVLEVVSNHGGATVGVREIEFYLDSVMVDISSTTFYAYASTVWTTDYSAHRAFGNWTSKIDTARFNAWETSSGDITNAWILVAINSPINFNKLVFNNSHESGDILDIGIQGFRLYTTLETLGDHTYGVYPPDYNLVLTSSLNMHSAVNEEDDQIRIL